MLLEGNSPKKSEWVKCSFSMKKVDYESNFSFLLPVLLSNLSILLRKCKK